jgi:hypothetical protein
MIRSLTIKGFLGIQALQLDVGPGGALIEGGNGRGKSSVMKAIKAALDSAGISPEAVRKGADAAEILIDLEHDTVRRRISAAGNASLTVEDENGSRRKAPQTYLSQLLGLALLDPLDLWLAPAKERRSMILRAVPCRATPELLELHVPEEVRSATWTDALGPEGFAQHGLDVVAQARSLFEGRRLAAGRLVKERQAAASAASLDATKAATAAEAHAGAPTKADATAALLDATSAKNEVDGRAAAGARSQAFLEGRQALITKLRADAAAVRQAAPAAPTPEEQEAALSVLHEAREAERSALTALEAQAAVVAELEEKLRQAQATRDHFAAALRDRGAETGAAEAMIAALERKEKAAHAAFERAAEIDERATSEETAVKLLDVSAPSPEEVAAAHERVRGAEAAVRRAHEAELAHEAARRRARQWTRRASSRTRRPTSTRRWTGPARRSRTTCPGRSSRTRPALCRASRSTGTPSSCRTPTTSASTWISSTRRRRCGSRSTWRSG